jgi:DNA-binding transcriptional MerR regulator
MAEIGIGKLAEITGVKIPTIRFYEQNGLVASPRRSEGGQRRYDESAVRRLHFIRHARDLGFSVEDIRQLLTLSEHPNMSCDAAEEIAHHHLRQVDGKIARLRLIRSELKRMIEACGGGSAGDCRILDTLSKSPAGKVPPGNGLNSSRRSSPR